MLVIVAEKMEWRLANMLAGRSSVRFAYDLERPTSKHFFRGRKLPDRCHRAKTRNEGNQQATHSLGKTAVLRHIHHAKTPTRQVGFSLPIALPTRSLTSLRFVSSQALSAYLTCTGTFLNGFMVGLRTLWLWIHWDPLKARIACAVVAVGKILSGT